MRCCLSFLQRAHAGGVRYVLVITGKGSSSGGEGVLRRAVPAWLSTPPFRAAGVAATTMRRASMAARARSTSGCGASGGAP